MISLKILVWPNQGVNNATKIFFLKAVPLRTGHTGSSLFVYHSTLIPRQIADCITGIKSVVVKSFLL